MSDANTLEAKFWKSLHSDRTMMVGLATEGGSHSRPMTAQAEGDHGPLWFFTSTDSGLLAEGGAPKPAHATFTAKGHGLFACVHGTLTADKDRAVIDRLWNPFVAAWYEDGKDDPKLALLRFDPTEAEIWENASSLVAGIRMLFGADPKLDYKDSTAKVDLS